VPAAPRTVVEVSRPHRHEEPGCYYHVVSRGNNKQVVFDDELRLLFLSSLVRIAERHAWRVIAWALMTNHYHLVLQIGKPLLSSGMRDLNTTLARASNARFGRLDHCFGRRYWSAHLKTDHYLLMSIRYAMWNPPRAGRCDDPAGSSWTSYRGSVGLEAAPPALALGELLRLFDPRIVTARRLLSDFVSEGRVRCQAPWDGPASR
jgi:REP element-mobilizing transposase RayT